MQKLKPKKPIKTIADYAAEKGKSLNDTPKPSKEVDLVTLESLRTNTEILCPECGTIKLLNIRLTGKIKTGKGRRQAYGHSICPNCKNTERFRSFIDG